MLDNHFGCEQRETRCRVAGTLFLGLGLFTWPLCDGLLRIRQPLAQAMVSLGVIATAVAAVWILRRAERHARGACRCLELERTRCLVEDLMGEELQ